jgi:hypothetical protein
MNNRATLKDLESQAGEGDGEAASKQSRTFEHPAQALRRILGQERFKSEHVYGVTAPRS